MPRIAGASTPKYCHHKASGQAVVKIGGKDHYLGPWKSKASRIEYDRLIPEWLANGRRAVPEHGQHVTVVELAAAFWQHAQTHYVKHGRQTDELDGMRVALKYLRDLYGHTDVADFRPLCLDVIRNKMIERGNCRTYINQMTMRLKHIFKWGVAKELVPETTYRALACVSGLQAGKSGARENDPVMPVDDATIEATIVHLRPVVQAMVRLQRLTGMRPGEVCLLRPADIDRSGEVWVYRPAEHKMEHKGRGRVIFIGPKGQDILRPYLLRDSAAPCFLPTVNAYRHNLHRAAAKAKVEPWSPNQLRHSAATEIRKRFGIEGAQVTLGHSSADVTQVYAERDLEKASSIMAMVG